MTDESTRLRVHVRNNINRDRPRPRGKLLDRSIYVYGVPRLMLLCRLFGHRPVVAGARSGWGGRAPARWVTCDRCDTRPWPQGDLDPAVFHRGDPYRGDFTGTPGSEQSNGWQAPGPFPPHPTGDMSFQIVVGDRGGGSSARVALGSAGSGAGVLDAHVAIAGLGGLYGGCERHGKWLQRRLIPDDHDDREITVRVFSGRLAWSLWGRDGHWSSTDPWWMHGSVRLNPLDIAFGPKIYSYDDVGDPQTVTVRMPHGDDHDVTVQLQRQHHGRERGRRRFQHWVADWRVVSGGIPVKRPSSSGVYGSAVRVSAAGAEDGGWAAEAAAAIAAGLTTDRARYGYRPEVHA